MKLSAKFCCFALKVDEQGNIITCVLRRDIPFSRSMYGIASDNTCKSGAEYEEWLKKVGEELDIIKTIVEAQEEQEMPSQILLKIQSYKRLMSFLEDGGKLNKDGARYALSYNKDFVGGLIECTLKNNHDIANLFMYPSHQSADYNPKVVFQSRETPFAAVLKGFKGEIKVESFIDTLISPRTDQPRQADDELNADEFKAVQKAYIDLLRSKNLLTDPQQCELNQHCNDGDADSQFAKHCDSYIHNTAGIVGYINLYIEQQKWNIDPIKRHSAGGAVPKEEVQKVQLYIQTTIFFLAAFWYKENKYTVPNWINELNKINNEEIGFLIKGVVLANDDVAKVRSIISFLKKHKVIGDGQMSPKVVALVTNLAGYANAFFFGNNAHDDEMFGDFLADKWEQTILKLGYASFTDGAKSDAAGEEPDGVIRLRLDKYLEGISGPVNAEFTELLHDKEYSGIEFGDLATQITWTSKVLPNNMVGIDLLDIDQDEFEIASKYPKVAEKYLELYGDSISDDQKFECIISLLSNTDKNISKYLQNEVKDEEFIKNLWNYLQKNQQFSIRMLNKLRAYIPNTDLGFCRKVLDMACLPSETITALESLYFETEFFNSIKTLEERDSDALKKVLGTNDMISRLQHYYPPSSPQYKQNSTVFYGILMKYCNIWIPLDTEANLVYQIIQHHAVLGSLGAYKTFLNSLDEDKKKKVVKHAIDNHCGFSLAHLMPLCLSITYRVSNQDVNLLDYVCHSGDDDMIRSVITYADGENVVACLRHKDVISKLRHSSDPATKESYKKFSLTLSNALIAHYELWKQSDQDACIVTNIMLSMSSNDENCKVFLKSLDNSTKCSMIKSFIAAKDFVQLKKAMDILGFTASSKLEQEMSLPEYICEHGDYNLIRSMITCADGENAAECLRHEKVILKLRSQIGTEYWMCYSHVLLQHHEIWRPHDLDNVLLKAIKGPGLWVFIKRDVALYCSSIISSPANTAIVLGVLRFNALLLKSFAGNLIATPASREALLASAAAVVTIIGLVMIAEEVCTILKPSAMKIFERYFNGHERSPDRPAQQGGVA